MEPDSGHVLALGRMEGKVETILSLLTANLSRTDTLAEKVNSNDKRLATLEAKSDARSDTSRYWFTTISSGLAILIAGLALAKDFFIR